MFPTNPSPHLEDNSRHAGKVRPAICIDSNLGVRRSFETVVSLGYGRVARSPPLRRGRRHHAEAVQAFGSDRGHVLLVSTAVQTPTHAVRTGSSNAR